LEICCVSSTQLTESQMQIEGCGFVYGLSAVKKSSEETDSHGRTVAESKASES